MKEISHMATSNIQAIEDIRYRLLTGAISYAQAKKEAQPVVVRMNKRGAELARESGIKYRPLRFITLMR